MDLAYSKKMCPDKILQGCSCEEGLLLTHDGHCVAESECPCYNAETKTYLTPGQVLKIPCQECTCKNGQLKCEDKSCEEIICPKEQIVIKGGGNRVPGECLAFQCPDKFSNAQTCVDTSLHRRKCVCREGFIETITGVCVPVGTCPCFYKDKWHIHGTQITDKCYLKKCENGIWKTLKKVNCQASCYIAGSEMRIVTFDGSAYNFPGFCTYTLVKTRGEAAGFKISSKNIACVGSGDACSHKIDIEYLGIHVQLVKGVGIVVGNNTYEFNQPISLGAIQIFSTTLYTAVSFEDVAVFWSGGLLTWIQVSNRWEDKLEGLCGSYDFNSKNDFMCSDNAVDNAIKFGLSWKENGIPCDDDNAIVTNTCQKYPQRRLWAESQCNIIKTSDLFQSCRQVMPQSHIDRFVMDCITEACLCDKTGHCECFCNSVAHFEAACNELGQPSKWRSQNLCPVQCENGMVYQPSENPCHKSCFNIAKNTSNCNINIGIEGCFCPAGYVWHNSNCIPQSSCPCYDDGFEYEPGTIVLKDCMNCTCIGGVLECQGENCSSCAEDEFECLVGGRCVPQDSVCNNFYDCHDGSDEAASMCDHMNCTENQFKCKESGECVLKSHVCDGIGHCADYSDEMQQCTAHCEFMCEGKVCILDEYICDGYIDCPQGDDEKSCESKVCEKGYTRCRNTSACILDKLLCDGHDDCGDGQDETGCSTSVPSIPPRIDTKNINPDDRGNITTTLPLIITIPNPKPMTTTTPTVKASTQTSPTTPNSDRNSSQDTSLHITTKLSNSTITNTVIPSLQTSTPHIYNNTTATFDNDTSTEADISSNRLLKKTAKTSLHTLVYTTPLQSSKPTALAYISNLTTKRSIIKTNYTDVTQHTYIMNQTEPTVIADINKSTSTIQNETNYTDTTESSIKINQTRPTATKVSTALPKATLSEVQETTTIPNTTVNVDNISISTANTNTVSFEESTTPNESSSSSNLDFTTQSEIQEKTLPSTIQEDSSMFTENIELSSINLNTLANEKLTTPQENSKTILSDFSTPSEELQKPTVMSATTFDVAGMFTDNAEIITVSPTTIPFQESTIPENIFKTNTLEFATPLIGQVTTKTKDYSILFTNNPDMSTTNRFTVPYEESTNFPDISRTILPDYTTPMPKTLHDFSSVFTDSSEVSTVHPSELLEGSTVPHEISGTNMPDFTTPVEAQNTLTMPSTSFDASSINTYNPEISTVNTNTMAFDKSTIPQEGFKTSIPDLTYLPDVQTTKQESTVTDHSDFTTVNLTTILQSHEDTNIPLEVEKTTAMPSTNVDVTDLFTGSPDIINSPRTISLLLEESTIPQETSITNRPGITTPPRVQETTALPSMIQEDYTDIPDIASVNPSVLSLEESTIQQKMSRSITNVPDLTTPFVDEKSTGLPSTTNDGSHVVTEIPEILTVNTNAIYFKESTIPNKISETTDVTSSIDFQKTTLPSLGVTDTATENGEITTLSPTTVSSGKPTISTEFTLTDIRDISTVYPSTLKFKESTVPQEISEISTPDFTTPSSDILKSTSIPSTTDVFTDNVDITTVSPSIQESFRTLGPDFTLPSEGQETTAMSITNSDSSSLATQYTDISTDKPYTVSFDKSTLPKESFTTLVPEYTTHSKVVATATVPTTMLDVSRIFTDKFDATTASTSAVPFEESTIIRTHIPYHSSPSEMETTTVISSTIQDTSSIFTGQTEIPTDILNTGQPEIPTVISNTGQPEISTVIPNTGQPEISTVIPNTGQPEISTVISNTGQPEISTVISNTGQHEISTVISNTLEGSTFPQEIYKTKNPRLSTQFEQLKSTSLDDFKDNPDISTVNLNTIPFEKSTIQSDISTTSSQNIITLSDDQETTAVKSQKNVASSKFTNYLDISTLNPQEIFQTNLPDFTTQNTFTVSSTNDDESSMITDIPYISTVNPNTLPIKELTVLPESSVTTLTDTSTSSVDAPSRQSTYHAHFTESSNDYSDISTVNPNTPPFSQTMAETSVPDINTPAPSEETTLMPSTSFDVTQRFTDHSYITKVNPFGESSYPEEISRTNIPDSTYTFTNTIHDVSNRFTDYPKSTANSRKSSSEETTLHQDIPSTSIPDFTTPIKVEETTFQPDIPSTNIPDFTTPIKVEGTTFQHNIPSTNIPDFTTPIKVEGTTFQHNIPITNIPDVTTPIKVKETTFQHNIPSTNIPDFTTPIKVKETTFQHNIPSTNIPDFTTPIKVKETTFQHNIPSTNIPDFTTPIKVEETTFQPDIPSTNIPDFATQIKVEETTLHQDIPSTSIPDFATPIKVEETTFQHNIPSTNIPDFATPIKVKETTFQHNIPSTNIPDFTTPIKVEETTFQQDIPRTKIPNFATPIEDHETSPVISITSDGSSLITGKPEVSTPILNTVRFEESTFQEISKTKIPDITTPLKLEETSVMPSTNVDASRKFTDTGNMKTQIPSAVPLEESTIALDISSTSIPDLTIPLKTQETSTIYSTAQDRTNTIDLSKQAEIQETSTMYSRTQDRTNTIDLPTQSEIQETSTMYSRTQDRTNTIDLPTQSEIQETSTMYSRTQDRTNTIDQSTQSETQETTMLPSTNVYAKIPFTYNTEIDAASSNTLPFVDSTVYPRSSRSPNIPELTTSSNVEETTTNPTTMLDVSRIFTDNTDATTVSTSTSFEESTIPLETPRTKLSVFTTLSDESTATSSTKFDSTLLTDNADITTTNINNVPLEQSTITQEIFSKDLSVQSTPFQEPTGMSDKITDASSMFTNTPDSSRENFNTFQFKESTRPQETYKTIIPGVTSHSTFGASGVSDDTTDFSTINPNTILFEKSTIPQEGSTTPGSAILSGDQATATPITTFDASSMTTYKSDSLNIKANTVTLPVENFITYNNLYITTAPKVQETDSMHHTLPSASSSETGNADLLTTIPSRSLTFTESTIPLAEMLDKTTPSDVEEITQMPITIQDVSTTIPASTAARETSTILQEISGSNTPDISTPVELLESTVMPTTVLDVSSTVADQAGGSKTSPSITIQEQDNTTIPWEPSSSITIQEQGNTTIPWEHSSTGIPEISTPYSSTPAESTNKVLEKSTTPVSLSTQNVSISNSTTQTSTSQPEFLSTTTTSFLTEQSSTTPPAPTQPHLVVPRVPETTITSTSHPPNSTLTLPYSTTITSTSHLPNSTLTLPYSTTITSTSHLPNSTLTLPYSTLQSSTPFNNITIVGFLSLTTSVPNIIYPNTTKSNLTLSTISTHSPALVTFSLSKNKTNLKPNNISVPPLEILNPLYNETNNPTTFNNTSLYINFQTFLKIFQKYFDLRNSSDVGICLSPWSAWTSCHNPCTGVKIRVRQCSMKDNCQCDKETLCQADLCECLKVSPSTPSKNTSLSPKPTFSSIVAIGTPTQMTNISEHCQCSSPKLCTHCREQCKKSCRAFRYGAVCHEEECLPGCECPKGQLMDDDGFCSPPDSCPCYDSTGKQRPFNSSFTDEKTCQTCKCGKQGVVCIDPAKEMEIFYTMGDWTEWSDCSANCNKGTMSRYRVGKYQSCSTTFSETKECVSTECNCFTEDGVIIKEGEMYQPDDCQICSCSNGTLTCSINPKKVVNGSWLDWGPWSSCAADCSLHYQSRCMRCQPPKCGGEPCDGSVCQTRPCTSSPCCDVFTWSEWSDCSQTCGTTAGYRIRHQIFPDDFTKNNCEIHSEAQECGHCACVNRSIEQWSEWTSCLASGTTCGWGKRSRTRKLGVACDGVPGTHTENCFLGPCECHGNLEWSNHSLCQRTCKSEPSPECFLKLSGGCVCPSSLVYNGTGCVPLNDCNLQCEYGSNSYQVSSY
ncbi:mucin-2-like [Physella acuta]|uniref:mucin-2-like n=1 Tax=Physella acuta TaxID=109671 RepID=UPI0027DB3E1C|nr:mucin-2-like [Physella acuta]